MAETTAYIGLGSNLGDRNKHINRALEMLGRAESVGIGSVSDIIETEALGSVVHS